MSDAGQVFVTLDFGSNEQMLERPGAFPVVIRRLWGQPVRVLVEIRKLEPDPKSSISPGTNWVIYGRLSDEALAEYSWMEPMRYFWVTYNTEHQGSHFMIRCQAAASQPA